jgi:hypothetical protein
MVNVHPDSGSHESRKIPKLFARKFFTSLCYVEKVVDKRKLLVTDHARFHVAFDHSTKCTVLLPPDCDIFE